jgi:hypothetical protein
MSMKLPVYSISGKVLMKAITPGNYFISLVIAAVLLSGCQPASLTTPADLSEKIYLDLQAINAGAQRYISEHGDLPPGNFWKSRATLVLEGYIQDYPTPPSAIFAGEPMDYRFDPNYGNIDAGDTLDAAIAVWGLKDEICREYNRRYAGDEVGAEIFDWKANGKKYPGEAIGRHITTYAIKWESDAVDDCEIEWVVKYR